MSAYENFIFNYLGSLAIAFKNKKAPQLAGHE
jgi:hypothetical protein